MNRYIAEGNEALSRGDYSAATTAFLTAHEDPDPLVQRIARNRLYEMYPEEVYASTHSYQNLYHRPMCSAKNVIRRNHIFWFRSWREAELAGFVPCQRCRPPRQMCLQWVAPPVEVSYEDSVSTAEDTSQTA